MTISTVARALRTVSLGVWLGGLVMAFIAAPVVFGVLKDDPTLAGLIVGGILKKASLLRMGLAVAALLAEGILIVRPGTPPVTGWRRNVPRGGLVLAVAVMLFSAFWLEPAIHALREKIGDFSAATQDLPERAEFRKLHGLSMALMLLEAILVALAFVAGAL